MDWRHHARCRPGSMIDPELFHPVGTTGDAKEQIDTAKAICALCQVKDDCLAFALTAPWKTEGIWGGVLFNGSLKAADRRELRRRVRVPA
jgi:WhiB family redox-sensing transcriptional regulator